MFEDVVAAPKVSPWVAGQSRFFFSPQWADFSNLGQRHESRPSAERQTMHSQPKKMRHPAVVQMDPLRRTF